MTTDTDLVKRELGLRAATSKNGDVHPARPVAIPQVAFGNGSQPLTVLNLLHCLRRRWRGAVSWGMLLGLLTLLSIVVFLPPAKPSAFSKVYFPPNPNRSLLGNQDIPLNPQTQKELLLSSKILDEVLKLPEVAELQTIKELPNPKSYLVRELHLDFPTGSEIMRITLSGDRPDDLVAIVDAVTLTYLSRVGSDSSTQRDRQLAHYESLYQKSKQDFDLLFAEMAKKGTSVFSSDSKTIAAQIQLVADQLKTRRSEAKTLSKRAEDLNRDLEEAKKKATQPVDRKDPYFEKELSGDSDFATLLTERKTIEKKRDADLPFLAEDHPDRKKYQNSLERVQKRIDARIKELEPEIKDKARERFRVDLEKLELENSRVQNQNRTAKEEVAQLEAEAARLSNAVASVEGKRPELLDKENEVNRYKGLLQKLKNEMDLPFRGEVLEPATVSIPNETSRRIRFGAIGFFLVFGTVLLGFAFREYRAHRIASSEEVSQHLGLPVVGTVPTYPQPTVIVNQTAAGELRWENLLRETVDSTRTLLLHTADTQGIRQILITSAVGNEGKTSLADQLARSLVRAGRKVILIDGDLRSPSLHSLFEVPLQRGVCEYLRGEATADSIVRTTTTPRLHVVTAGVCDPGALQQLSMNGFMALLEELRSEADFILIDSSPVLPVADALLMARYVDGVLMSLMCDVSQMDRVNMAIHRLQGMGARVIGAIVNGSSEGAFGYGADVTPAK